MCVWEGGSLILGVESRLVFSGHVDLKCRPERGVSDLDN